jgi:hypothetical protein
MPVLPTGIQNMLKRRDSGLRNTGMTTRQLDNYLNNINLIIRI